MIKKWDDQFDFLWVNRELDKWNQSSFAPVISRKDWELRLYKMITWFQDRY